ncbi:MAG TPA: cbb3-type cytochrome c oxidase N-terminal domain-containing protein [Kofleriaceae bacterium]|nr:cbb3-type cytochrome c oxidase N-terminal domain-containing protein [Kofleriaceae bacterium]
MEHDVDGIREYDNPLPFWWTGIFVASVVWAVGYFIWFHGGGPGKTPAQEYTAARADWEARRAAADQAAAASVTEESLAALASDPTTIEKGRGVFTTRCVTCHAEGGKGLVGPNLTDDNQIHGTTRMDLYRTVYDGVPIKGMLSWGPQLPPDEITAVVAFVSTLRGTHAPGGKAPEGDPVKPFPR